MEITKEYLAEIREKYTALEPKEKALIILSMTSSEYNKSVLADIKKFQINSKNYNLIEENRMKLLYILLGGEPKLENFYSSKLDEKGWIRASMFPKAYQANLSNYLLPYVEIGILIKDSTRIPPPEKKGRRIVKYDSPKVYYQLAQNEIVFLMLEALFFAFALSRRRKIKNFDLLETPYGKLINKELGNLIKAQRVLNKISDNNFRINMLNAENKKLMEVKLEK